MTADPHAAARARHRDWWAGSLERGPLVHVVARLDKPRELPEAAAAAASPADRYLDIERKALLLRNRLRTHAYLADALPILDTSIISGSLSLYLGVEPVFAEETAWHRHDSSVLDRPLPAGPHGAWWDLQVGLTRRALELCDGRLQIGHPNLHENLDALADMAGAQALCYALADRPRDVQALIERLDGAWLECFDRLYGMVAPHNGGSGYATKHVWGPGRTAKVQCDFAALISPEQFRRHVLPSLGRQCARLDHSMFHLDGPPALRHLDLVLGIEELDALQFTPGAGQACASHPRWLPVYERALEAGKAIQVELSRDSEADWRDNVARLLDRVGPKSLYLVYPDVSEERAAAILAQLAA